MTKSKARQGRGLIFFIPLILLLALFLSMKPYTVSGRSMAPTLPENSRVWVESLSYGLFRSSTPLLLWAEPRRNSIVQYYHDQRVIKRCVAVPGDPVEVVGTLVILNNTQYQVTRSVAEQLKSMDVIPEGYYFFVGDNLSESTDSRHYGLIAREDICGKVWSFEGS